MKHWTIFFKTLFSPFRTAWLKRKWVVLNKLACSSRCASPMRSILLGCRTQAHCWAPCASHSLLSVSRCLADTRCTLHNTTRSIKFIILSSTKSIWIAILNHGIMLLPGHLSCVSLASLDFKLLNSSEFEMRFIGISEKHVNKHMQINKIEATCSKKYLQICLLNAFGSWQISSSTGCRTSTRTWDWPLSSTVL